MTTMEMRKSARVAAPVARSLSSRIVGFVQLLFLWQERWEQRERLGGLDEHMLRDIGLSRADAVRESDKPFWRI
jgi:uncharacterized protein YjiS (DUF1127 family)